MRFVHRVTMETRRMAGFVKVLSTGFHGPVWLWIHPGRYMKENSAPLAPFCGEKLDWILKNVRNHRI